MLGVQLGRGRTDSLRSARDSDFASLNPGYGSSVLEFPIFGAHTGAVYGGARMPLTGPVPTGGTFFCPHCGALYAVTYSRLAKSESNSAKCVVCLQTMDRWDSTKVPSYKLVHRPEDA